LKSSYRIFVFIIPFLFSIKSTAQKIQLDFNLVSGKNGISLGKINGITQDKWGYMWFVDQTNSCIIRFDGYRMKTYRNDPLDTNSIYGVNHECIAADSTGCIWVDAAIGIDKFDPYTGKFIHFRYQPTKGGRKEIYKILIDHLGTVWVGTSVGLDRLDQKTGKFIHYEHKENDPASLSFNIVRSLYEDHQGVLWIGTGFPFLPEKGGGLNRFDRKTETFTSYLHEPDNPHSLINDKIGAIFEDSRGIFWIGTQGDGLHIMDRKTGSFTRLTYDPNHPEKLSRPPVNKGNPMDHITFITEDMAGAIWIGTYAAGINRYDPVTKKITHFELGNGFRDISSWTSFLSHEGVLWISTENGEQLYQVDPSHRPIDSISTVNLAANFLEDNKGYLWVATWGNGLLKYDHNKKLIKQYKNDPSNPFSLNDNNVNSLFQSQEDTIWVGTWKGLQIFNKAKQQFSRIPDSMNLKDSLDNAITTIYQDKQGVMWFGRFSGGLIQYNPKDHSFQHYYSNTEDSTSIGTNVITDILEDRSGILWVGTMGEGINRLNRETGSFKRYMSFSKVNNLYEDSGGSLWAGTGNGLYNYNQKEDRFISFFDPLDKVNSLGIMGIIEDNSKNLWLKSGSAIIKLNPVTKETFIYGSSFGIRPNSLAYLRGIYKNKQGQLYIGYENGFYTFFPEELGVKTDLKIIITDLSINTFPVLPGKGSPIQEPVEEISDLELRYNRNNISFNFSAIDYRKSAATKYFTMLENYDNTWREAVNEKSSTYINVSPGTYVYRVRAYNSEGVKTEKAITIRIYPPWWQTWWFRTSAIILLAASFYLLIRWWLNRKFRLQLERTEKEKQLVELEMQALRSQMNPHFIFNSLNSINMFILENNKLKASEYLTKFSRLIRLILQNSQEAFIHLERELEALQLYLELESLRFEQRFEYKITVAGNVDTAMLKVPPLIIQPYAENAIWHGLMQKKEKGHLEIELYQQKEILFCKITDDGIGRKHSAELHSKSTLAHKSMGMRITADRIAMSNQNNPTDSCINVKDLVLADGSAGGTEVLLEIPVGI
jgi:ligand-binding sensor domain-containing protein